MLRNKRLLLLFTLALVFSTTFATIPSGYYDNAKGKSGETLLKALYGIIGSHTKVSYANVWTSFAKTDENSAGKIIDIYSTKLWTYKTDQAGNFSGVGEKYNREHSVPNSWWGGTDDNRYTDLFHLYPTDGAVNGQRSNYPYGECSKGTSLSASNGVTPKGKLGTCTYSGYTGTVFEPDDEYKGDLARTYFYFATCYYSGTYAVTGSGCQKTTEAKQVFAGNTYPVFTTWYLNMMLEWDREDPVSDKETARNEAIYAIQGNRNPYIDHPELVEYVWGTYASSSTGWTGSSSSTTTPTLTSPTDGSTINVGSTTSGTSITKTVTVKGTDLTKALTVSVSGTGYSVSTSSITAANANSGTTITITYKGTTTGTNTGTLKISSSEVSSTVTLNTTVTSSSTTTGSLTSPTNGSTVNVGTVQIGTTTNNKVSKTITVKGTNLTSNVNVAVSGTGFTVSSQQLSYSNVNNGTTITVYYTSSTAGSATGTLTLSGTGISTVTVNLTASATASSTTTLTAPVATTATNIGTTSFTANWSCSGSNVQSYNLYVNVDDSGSGSTTSSPTQKISSSFTSGLADGWTATSSTYYSDKEGYYRLGTGSGYGTITSSAFTTEKTDSKVSVIVNAKYYESDGSSMVVALLNSSGTRIDSTTFDLTSSFADYTAVFSASPSTSYKIKITGTAAKKRIYLNTVKIYSGDASSSSSVRRKAAAETGDATTRTITGIPAGTTSYTVTDLTQGSSNTYYVKAVYSSGTSDASNKINVQLLTPTTTTLANMVKTGSTAKAYTVTDLTAVYYKDGVLYCKDSNGYANKSSISSDEIDYMGATTALQTTSYDQSNWIALDIPSGSESEAEILPGSTLTNVTGTLTNITNPEMTVETVPTSKASAGYTKNTYITSSFVGTQLGYYFVTPKPMEIATITWAQWSSSANAFVVPTGAGANSAGLSGSFYANFTLLDEQPSLVDGNVYKMTTALIKNETATTSTSKSARRKASASTMNYVVYPLDLTSNSIVTAVDDVTAAKSVVGVRYYNLMGMESAEPFSGLNVVVTTYSDGSISSAKVMR